MLYRDSTSTKEHEASFFSHAQVCLRLTILLLLLASLSFLQTTDPDALATVKEKSKDLNLIPLPKKLANQDVCEDVTRDNADPSYVKHATLREAGVEFDMVVYEKANGISDSVKGFVSL
jgi:hypothetical protein